MTIDCHGHHTTAPKALEAWRPRRIAGIADPAARPRVSELRIGDDELRESIETDQLRLMREREIDRCHVSTSCNACFQVFEGKARRVCPRLDAVIGATS